MRARLSFILIASLVCASVAMSTNAFADIYVPLSGQSPLTCVFTGSGKTHLAQKAGDRYRKVAFEAALKVADKSRAKTRARIADTKRFIKELEQQKADGATQWNLSVKQLKALGKLFTEGKVTLDVSANNLNDLILATYGVRDTFISELAYYNQLMRLIRLCKTKKLPESGQIDIVYKTIIKTNYREQGDFSGEGYVVVLAKVPNETATSGKQGYFCFEVPAYQGGGARYASLSNNPCYSSLLSELGGTCDELRERDEDGKPLFYYALLEKKNFYFKERIGGVRLDDAARAAEAELRASKFTGGWELFARWVKVSNVDKCTAASFL